MRIVEKLPGDPETHEFGTIVHLAPKPVAIVDVAACTRAFEKTAVRCNGCEQIVTLDSKMLTADYDLCAHCFFTNSSSRCDWSIWELRPADSTGVACDGCSISPAGGGCQACYDKGCFNFDDTTRTKMGEVGVCIEPGNYFDKWPSYRADIFRGIAKPREVICVICNETHTTLTNSYLAWDHMHVRDYSEDDFVCEWCQLVGCVSCGHFFTVNESKDAEPGLWMKQKLYEKHFVCPVCVEAKSMVRNTNDFRPTYKHVRTGANKTSRMHCPGCHARIKDGSLFTQKQAETNDTKCAAEAAAQEPAAPVEQQQSCPSLGGDCATATDKVLALFRSVMNPKSKS